MNHKMVSIADQIYMNLEHDILTGVYERDELLTEIHLSEALGVSRTPVREALRRLGQEHIVEITTKGAKVIGITEQDLRDIYEIRYLIEGRAAFKAARVRDPECLKELKDYLDLQEFYTAKGDKDRINDADSAFHDALYRAAFSPTFFNTLSPLHKRIVKYRGVSVETPERATASLEEHRGIYNAILSGDAALSERLTREHIRHAAESILGGESLWD